jgi:hypothetical protein
MTVSQNNSALSYLIFKAMFLPAIFFDLGIDVLHEGVPLHQHVCEGGAGEDPHHLSTVIGQIIVT